MINYPNFNIRSKNEIAKRISSGKLSRNVALALINDCLANFDSLWTDNSKMSEPEKKKWVRDASRTKLGRLLGLIDKRLFLPYDSTLPNFIHGGVSNKGVKSAANSLLGDRRKRTLLKLDMSRFFEHVNLKRLEYVLIHKLGFSRKPAKVICKLCCVSTGPKSRPENKKTIARGFATSNRLAIWCNLELFYRIEWLTKKRLGKYNAKLAIYVDDISITASRVPPKAMADFCIELIALINKYGNGLEVNDNKTKIIDYLGNQYLKNGVLILDENSGLPQKGSYEVLGIKMERNRLAAGRRTAGKIQSLKTRKSLSVPQKKSLKGLKRYKCYIEH